MRLGTIDVGSQSIRMSIFEFSEAGLEAIHSDFEAIALGRQGFDEPVLPGAVIKDLVALFHRYSTVFDAYDVQVYSAVATSAMRNLKNGQEVIDTLRSETRLEVVIIDGEEEAELSYQGVQDVVGPCSKPRWLVDIGGGSVEIIAEKADGQAGAWSLPLGSFRFPYLCGQAALNDAGSLLQKAADTIRKELKVCASAHMPAASDIYALGGNVRALGWILSNRVGSPKNQPAMDSLDVLIREAAELRLEERVSKYEISETRSETIISTAAVLHTIAETFGADYVSTPHVNLRRCMAAFLRSFVRESGPLAVHPLTIKLGRKWKDA